MQKLHTEEMDNLFRAILSLKDADECYKFFEDICTVKELIEISQRLKAAAMLKRGENYAEVCRVTGMSTATVSRVNKCLSYGDGGYAMVLDRMKEEEK